VVEVVAQATWLWSRVRWGRVRIRSRLEQVEREALQVWAEVLAINHDSRPLELTYARLEVAVGHHKGLLLETEGAVAVGLRAQSPQAELLELALRRV